MKGFYYRSVRGGRLYFSENEIARIDPNLIGSTVQILGGATYDVATSVPVHVENESPFRESVPNDHFYKRS